MATIALTDATTWVHGYDFTTDTNQVSLAVEVEELEATTFGSGGYRSRIAGLRTVSAELNGYWQSAESGAVDPEAFGDLGVADRVVTMSPTGAETSVAYMFQAGKFSYQLFGEVGQVTPFTLTCTGTNSVGVVRGQVAKAKGSVSATGAVGSPVDLGAVGTGQYLYATVHVFSAGTSITIQVESDDTQAFTTPTTVATIGPLTATGGTWMTRVPGPLADAWYRFNVTAVTGTFTLAGAIGIH